MMKPKEKYVSLADDDVKQRDKRARAAGLDPNKYKPKKKNSASRNKNPEGVRLGKIHRVF